MRNQTSSDGYSLPPAKTSLPPLLISLIGTVLIAGWYFFSFNQSYYSPYAGYMSTHNFVFLSGAKEWLIVWAILWIASAQQTAKAYARIIPAICVALLVAIDSWVLIPMFTWGNSLLVWIPVILFELCNLYWLYVGVVLALFLSGSCLIPLSAPGPLQRATTFSRTKLKKTFFRSLLMAAAYLVLIILAAIGALMVFGGGGGLHFSRFRDTLIYILSAPAFRFLCGLGSIAILYLFTDKSRRTKAAGIALLYFVVFILYSIFLTTWGSHFSMISFLWNGITTRLSIWQILTVVALSPVFAFFTAAFVITLCGYQFKVCDNLGRIQTNENRDDGESNSLEGDLDSEMYL